MSGISSGIGLISGIDTASLIEQLIAIDARPIRTFQTRIGQIDGQRAALLAISAQLLALRSAASNMDDLSFFRKFSANSTNESVLSARADEDATPGSFSFRVRSLVSNDSVISRGFTNTDSETIGAGSISIEIGNGRVNRSTRLDELNGGSGVRLGVITITDRSDASAQIDLSDAQTVDDVLDAINSNTKISVRARVTSLPLSAVGAGAGATGDRIVLEDVSDASGSVGRLVVTDAPGGFTAADLGIAANTLDSRVDGTDLVGLSERTPLSLLNDGNGVGKLFRDTDLIVSTPVGDFNVSLTDVLELSTDLRAVNGGNGVRLGDGTSDIRVTDRSGATADIDLSTATTIRDVRDLLNAAGIGISATVVNAHLQITDTTNVSDAQAGNLIIEDLTGFAAADLGIAASVESDAIIGQEIYRVSTIGDVIRAINFAPGNNDFVQASLSADGNGISLRALVGPGTVTVASANGSTAAQDLGIEAATFGSVPFDSRRLIAGLNTVLLGSLRGGSGVGGGPGTQEIRFTDRAGQTALIDFSAAQTLSDVVDLINVNATTGFSASVNSSGTGVELRDASGAGGPLSIEDVSGSLAADLGLAISPTDGATFEGNVVQGGNAQLQYISRQTLLTELNQGQGVDEGRLRITDSLGAIYAVEITGVTRTIGGVIDAINSATPDTIEARINDTGDGLVVIDTSAGDGSLTIQDFGGGRTASDLNIADTAASSESFIDGSFEIRIDVAAGDTLDSLVRSLNAAGAGISASIINDGSSVTPFGLTIASTVSGSPGELTIDTGNLDLGLSTLSRASDAVISIGGGAGGSPRLITSPTNSLDGVVEGVTFDLNSASDEEVTVNVTQDVDGIVEAVKGFVDRFNDVQGSIDTATSFDTDTFARGPLLGDRTVNQIRGRLNRVIGGQFDVSSDRFSRLFSVGIGIGSGNRMEFDEERFREAYADSPRSVEELFTTAEDGFGAVIQEVLDELTRDFDGVITRRDNVLTEQQDLLNGRIDSLNLTLEAKRQRLRAQFVAMERALAGLQGQQSALGILSQATGGLSFA